MSDYPMLISNKLHSFRNFPMLRYENIFGNGSIGSKINNTSDISE